MKLILNSDGTVFATHGDDQDVAHLYPAMTEMVVPDDTAIDTDEDTGTQTISGTQPAGWEAAKAELQARHTRKSQQQLILRIVTDDKRVHLGLDSIEDLTALREEIKRLEGTIVVTGRIGPGPHS